MQQEQDEANDQFNQVFEHYNNDCLFKAYEVYSSIPNKPKQHVSFILRLEKEYQIAKQLIDKFDSEDGWNMVHETSVHPATNATTKTFYRQVPDSPMHSIKIDSVIPSAMFNVLAIFYEIDLYKQWVPRMSHSSIVKEYPEQKYRFLCYYKFDMIWPFSNRDVVCYGFGVDMLKERNAILVVVHSIDDDEELRNHCKEYHNGSQEPVDVPPANQNSVVRMSCEIAGFLIEYISPTQTRVKIISQVDPKLSYTPAWVINTCTEKFSHMAIDFLMNKTQDVERGDGPWAERTQKQVYTDIRSRLGM